MIYKQKRTNKVKRSFVSAEVGIRDRVRKLISGSNKGGGRGGTNLS